MGISLFALALQASAAGTSTPLDAYFRCSVDNAVSFIPSGESADILAGVAQKLCERLIEPAADWQTQFARTNPPEDRLLLLARLREGAREAAVAAIVATKVRRAANQK